MLVENPKAARTYILRGQVSLNGKTCCNPDTPVKDRETVEVLGDGFYFGVRREGEGWKTLV